MNQNGISHFDLSTLDLDKTRKFYEAILEFKAVVADAMKIEEGGYLRHIFFDVANGQLIAFLGPREVADRERSFAT